MFWAITHVLKERIRKLHLSIMTRHFTGVHAEECSYIFLSLQRSAKQSLIRNVVNKTLENFGKFVYSLRTVTS